MFTLYYALDEIKASEEYDTYEEVISRIAELEVGLGESSSFYLEILDVDMNRLRYARK